MQDSQVGWAEKMINNNIEKVHFFSLFLKENWKKYAELIPLIKEKTETM